MKSKKIRSVQLEDKYYKYGENAQFRKIFDYFRFLVQIFAKIIINFSDFTVFPFLEDLSSSWILIFLAWLKSAYFFDFINFFLFYS